MSGPQTYAVPASGSFEAVDTQFATIDTLVTCTSSQIFGNVLVQATDSVTGAVAQATIDSSYWCANTINATNNGIPCP